jgi:hypothetical protein
VTRKGDETNAVPLYPEEKETIALLLLMRAATPDSTALLRGPLCRSFGGCCEPSGKLARLVLELFVVLLLLLMLALLLLLALVVLLLVPAALSTICWAWEGV